MSNNTIQSRLSVLINTAKAKGTPATDKQISKWLDCLQKGKWIPGTPWNIPQHQHHNIISHFNKVTENGR